MTDINIRNDSPVESVMDLEKAEPTAQTADCDSETVAGSTTASSEDLPLPRARCIALVTALATAPFLNTVAIHASIIILPSIGRDLEIPSSRQQWVISAYNLTFGCFLLLCGRLADVYGRRQIFLLGSSTYTAASIMAPFIPNEIGFDTMRGLQGLGAAAMAPTALGILASTFPPGKAKDMAFGCFVIGAPLGSIFGQVFGGVVSQYLSWQWVYWIFGIMAAVSTVASYYIIPSPPPQPKRKNKHGTIDWIGGALITIGLVILIFALSQGNVVGWRTPWIPTLIALSLLIVVGFGYWQHYLETKTTKQPLMKMSIFKQKNFIAANVLMALFFSAFGTFIVFASYWFQAYQGLSVMQTSLRFIPNGITGIFVATITGYLMSRIRAEYILFFSTICIGLASLLFAIPIPVDTTYWAYGFPAMLLCVCGADTMYPVLTLFVTKTLPAKDASLGGALITAVGQIGRTIGLAIATALQMAIVAREKGVSVEKIDGKGRGLPPWDDALKVGIRTTAWFNFAISMTAALVVIVFIRGMGVIGGNRQSR